MPFVPKYNTKYILPIVKNIREFFKAGEEEAFLWAAESGPALRKTEIWRISRWYNTLFPVTSIIPVRTTPAESEDASRIDETHLITVETEIEGSDPDVIAEEVCQRINAYDAMLRKIGKQELLAGLNLTTSGGEWLDIGSHNYEYFAQTPSLYKITCGFQLTVKVIEGRNTNP